MGLVVRMAERKGFEPLIPFRVCRLSKPESGASSGDHRTCAGLCRVYTLSIRYMPMTRIPVTKARKTLSDVVSHVAFGGDRVVLSRNGRDLAAIIPMDVYRRIEAEEDRLDLADLRRAKREAEERGEKPIPYEEVRAALGLAASPARKRRKGNRR